MTVIEPNLEEQTRPLNELVVEKMFKVDYVVSDTHSYKASLGSSRIILKVIPEENSSPIRTLEFYGFSPVRGGDYIYAQIQKADAREETVGRSDGHPIKGIFYYPRDFKETETALRIDIKNEKCGGVLRTDHCRDYDKIIIREG